MPVVLSLAPLSWAIHGALYCFHVAGWKSETSKDAQLKKETKKKTDSGFKPRLFNSVFIISLLYYFIIHSHYYIISHTFDIAR